MELRTITHMYEPSTLPQRPQGGGEDVHVAQPGDTVDTIAHQYGAPPGLIRQINPQIRDGDRIPVGDTVNLPGGGNPAPGGPVGSTEMPHVGMPGTGNGMPSNPVSGGGLPIIDVIVRTIFPSNGNVLSLPLGGDNAPRGDQGGVALGLPKSDIAIPVAVPDRGASDANAPQPPADGGATHADANASSSAPAGAGDAPKSAGSPNAGTVNNAANATNAANAANPAQVIAAVALPQAPNAGATTMPASAFQAAASGAQVPTAATLVLVPTSAPAQAAPTTAAGMLQPAVVAALIAPEEPPPATQGERRDLPRSAETSPTVVQARGEAERPANEGDPARLLRDVQARILSDPRLPTETTRNSAFADQNLKSQEKPALNRASGDATAEEVAKNSGLLPNERSARAWIRNAGDAALMFDWVGQWAQLKHAYARRRAADSSDLPTTVAAIGGVVVVIAGLFALYALYRYWAPH